MFQQNFLSSLLATHIAYKHLKENGLLILTGAAHAFNNVDPSMATYVLTKNMVHNLHLNVFKDPKFLGKNIVTIVPTILDTPANRTAIPNQNKDDWIPPEKIAE